MNVRHLLLAVAVAVPAAALAHHGWSEYDSTQTLKLTGTIEAAGYEHPHGHIKLKTPAKTWDAVLAPPSRMEARGLSRDMLKVGVEATVEGYPNKGKPDEMRAERITVGGRTVELR
ncbi:MAG: DUF6152 family protein [Burkholderiales bacterium]